MKIVPNLIKDSTDEFLVQTTYTINKANPIVDRIIDDDSIEGVILTNQEGTPVYTNLHALSATICGMGLRQLGHLCKMYLKEFDLFDELLVVRVKTLKVELLMSPHEEFNIIVVQHARNTRAKHKNILKHF